MTLNRLFCIGFVAMGLVPSHVQAQAVGEIRGTVTDPTGAVVPGAKVTAEQAGTQLKRFAITSNAGTYSIPILPVGTYTLQVEASGFKNSTSEVKLDVDQQREVNFNLAVSGTSTEVHVSAAAEVLNTTNATLGGLVTEDQVSVLPLNGRDITGLVFLQPGISQEINSLWYGLSYWAGNGNRGQTNASYLDGIDSSDSEGGGAQFTGFNLDGVSEFKVLQNNYSAEYGRGGGTIVSLVTKSGTNELHGSAFEFVRNSDFDSRNFFSPSVPPFKRNEYGVTVGGPVVIPRLYNGKNKTFFFGEWAAFRQRRGSPIIESVPTSDERKGILDITGSNGKPDQLLVPLNPVTQTVLSHYPMPNDPTGPYGPNTFAFQYSIPENHDQYSGRIDHRFSDTDSLFVRFTYLNQSQPAADPWAAYLNPAFSAVNGNNQRNVGITHTHIFSPTKLNTFKAGLTKTAWINSPRITSVTQTAFSDGSLASYGPDTFVSVYYLYNYSFTDSFNWTIGRHSLSIGGEYRRFQGNDYGASTGGPGGTFFFSPGTPLPFNIPSASGQNNLAAGTPSPSSILSFLTGVPSVYTRSIPMPGFGPSGGGFAPFAVRRYHASGWFQDDFRVSPKLTLNLGLRYEYSSVVHEAAGRFTAIVDDPKFGGGNLFGQLILNPDPLYRPDYRGFGPRFGLAYKLTDHTVLRGGWGVFTNLIPTVFPDQAAVGFPFASYSSVKKPTYSLTPLSVAGLPNVVDLQGNVLPPNGNTKQIKPNTPVNLAPVASFFGSPLVINLTSLNLRNGYTMSGNFTVEQELPGEITIQAGYVSNNAVGLFASEWPNAYTGAQSAFTPYSNINPGLGEFQLTDNHAHSTYNSLQAVFRKTSRKHGLQFQVSYTWSKALDNASTVWNAAVPEGALLQNNPFCWSCEKGPSGFDVPQILSVNFIYQIPMDTWAGFSRLPKRLTTGWGLTSIFRAQSGFPFTVTSPYGTKEYGTDTYTGFQPTRPNLIQTPTMRSGGSTEEQFFSDAVVADGANLGQQFFATPGAAVNGVQDAPGNLGRNTFRAEPWSNTDLSLVKDTKITEKYSIQFRSEFFNLLNQHAFQAPEAVLGNPGFGKSSATVEPERQIQFALRFIF